MVVTIIPTSHHIAKPITVILNVHLIVQKLCHKRKKETKDQRLYTLAQERLSHHPKEKKLEEKEEGGK